LQRHGDQFIEALARGFLVIKAFGPERPAMTLSEVAEVTDLSRAGARRILLTLQALGYATLHDRKFSLTPRVLELGQAYVSTLDFSAFARPYMEKLSEEVGESSSIAVLDDTEVVFVARVNRHRLFTLALHVGSRLPAYVHSLGRVLLGGLDDAELARRLAATSYRKYTQRTIVDPAQLLKVIVADRKKGWSLVSGELEEGVAGVSAPIYGRNARIVAALNVNTNVNRMPEQELLKHILPKVQKTAEQISDNARFLDHA
jgi:IclR family pca regulon transcriptional regulator